MRRPRTRQSRLAVLLSGLLVLWLGVLSAKGQEASPDALRQAQGTDEDELIRAVVGTVEQQHVLKDQGASSHTDPQPAPAQDRAREGVSSVPLTKLRSAHRVVAAERLYQSSVKILAVLKQRSDANAASQGGSNGHARDTLMTSSSTLLVPETQTPLLDYLETTLSGRTKYLGKLLHAYRRQQRRAASQGPDEQHESINWFAKASKSVTRVASQLPLPGLRMGTRKLSVADQQNRAALSLAVDRLHKAWELGKLEAGLILADLNLWGRYSLPSNISAAFDFYSSVAEQTGDSYAQYMLGFLHSSNYGYSASSVYKEGEGDQGAALLYYTFAALAGQTEAEITLGYRHWVGVGVPQNCQEALPWYKSAADKAIAQFNTGPPGGRHLPPPKLRLADVTGGVYGPGSSAISANPASHYHPSHKDHHHPTTEREWEDVLEYYQFHADRGDPAFMFRIGRLYYSGYNPVGPNGGGGAENGGRDFARAQRWFMRIARTVWPRDPQAAWMNPAHVHTGGKARQVSLTNIAYYDVNKDVKLKVEDHLAMAAGLAAGFLGKMYLRGEGFAEQDYAKAFLWFQRGIGQGDKESHNGLGIMYRDGLGVPKDLTKSVSHFETAASADHAEAHINLGKHHMARGELLHADQHFDAGIRHGDGFQGYYYKAELNALQTNRPDLCPITTAFYKIVAERGDWETSQPWWEAEKAWAAGDVARALLGYWIMAERGYEVAQNNVAWVLDQDKKRLALPYYDTRLLNITDRLALIFWTRSATQDNVDALVKMGDYYFKGLGVASGIPQFEKAAACYASAAGTQISSIAMHNLGWMHENGVGVSQDFHLAKRYYDLSLEANPEAYLPVTLSLVKLHFRSLYKAVMAGDIKSISLFLSNEYLDEATEDANQSKQPWFWSWRKIRDEFFRRWYGEEMARQQAARRQAGGHDHEGHTDQQQLDAAREEMERDDDPVEWARRRREDIANQQHQQQDDYGDDLDIPDFFGDTIGGRGREGGDDLLESLAIVGLCLALGWLVYIRQARYDGARARQQAQNMQALQNPPPPAPGAIPRPPQANGAGNQQGTQRQTEEERPRQTQPPQNDQQ